jgi:hypothetical protein
MCPRGGKAEIDDGTDKCPVLVSTSTGLPNYVGHANWRPDLKCAAVRWAGQHIFYPRAKVVRRFVATWTDTPPLAQRHDLNSCRQREGRCADAGFLCPVEGRLVASHRAEAACSGGDGTVSRTLVVPEWRS